jgi:anti-anti-sigma factor
MTDQARIQVSVRNGVAIVEVHGEIDILNAPDLRSALQDAARKSSAAVIISLEHTAYFDSQTLEILVDFSKRLALNRRPAALVAPLDTGARRLLDIAGIENAVPLYASVEEAVEATARTM